LAAPPIARAREWMLAIASFVSAVVGAAIIGVAMNGLGVGTTAGVGLLVAAGACWALFAHAHRRAERVAFVTADSDVERSGNRLALALLIAVVLAALFAWYAAFFLTLPDLFGSTF
jgi:hypothetical protein